MCRWDFWAEREEEEESLDTQETPTRCGRSGTYRMKERKRPHGKT